MTTTVFVFISGLLVLIDFKNDRCGAGTSVLGDPVVAPELMATLA